MTDASDPPVEGAEPRSVPDPVPEPLAPGDAGPPSVPPTPIPDEPLDGEAMPPADELAAEPAETDPAPSASSSDGPTDEPAASGQVVEPSVGDTPAAGSDAAPAAAEVAPAEPDVAPAGSDPVSTGSDRAPVATTPQGEGSVLGAVVGPADVTGPDPDQGAPIGADPVAASDGPTTSTVPEGPAEAAPASAAGATPGEEPPASAPAGAEGGTGAPVLPPPPPELAEVPTDAGRIVGGKVREVRGDDVVVDLDDGRTGVINRRNLGVEGDPATVLSPGDPVEGAVLARSDPQHRVVLSRTWALKKRAWEAVAAAAAENAVLTGKVVSIGQKGVVVDVGVRGFVPASHLELGPVADLQAYAGTELTLRVLDLDVERERLVLSRRSLLLKEQRRSLHDVLAALEPGEVRRGKVATLSDYGAFVDLGGVNGLVHLSELSWQRVRHPSEVLSVGDEVEVKVLDVKVKKRRVSLSIRQLSADPLTTLVPGEIRTGPVTRLVDFGAFVDLSGVEGLVHLSELAEYRVSAPEEIVAPGEEVRVKVLSVDKRRRRVELSIRQAAEYGG